MTTETNTQNIIKNISLWDNDKRSVGTVTVTYLLMIWSIFCGATAIAAAIGQILVTTL